CFLSGGLDSSSVAAFAARAFAEQGKRLATYTQVPRPGFKLPEGTAGYADETPYVEAISETLGNLDVTYVRNSELAAFADLARVLQAMTGPVRAPANLGWMLAIMRLARSRNQRVLLGGDLGNVTVSWDGWPQALDNLLHGRLVAAARQWRLLYRIPGRSRLGRLRVLFLQ